MSEKTLRIHVVGTGCPDARAERYGSAFVLDIGQESLLIDCGPATTYKMARMGIPPTRVNHVFFTHHHFDHNADFPCFALTRWDQCKGTEDPLRVYGPPPTESFVEALLGKSGAFFVDWDSRVKHPASHECHTQRGGVMPRPEPAIEAKDVTPGPIARSDSWTASAVHVHHVEPTMISMAYRFDTDRGSIVFAGDCGDCDELRRLAKGVDTLVLACTHFGCPEASPVIADVIIGTPQVVDILRECEPRCVILTHMSPNFERPDVRKRAVMEVTRSYKGVVLCPDELTTVDLPASRETSG